jgi:hypothetical protein
VGWIYFPFALTTSLALCPITGLEARRRRRSHGHVGLLRSPAVEYLEFPGLGVGLGTFGISSCVIVHPETAHGNSLSPNPSKSPRRTTESPSKVNVFKLYTTALKQFTHVFDSLLPMLVCVWCPLRRVAHGKMVYPTVFLATPLL